MVAQNPKDKSATKRKLEYWIELAKILERGDINALFLADTYGGYDTYEDSLDNCIRRAAQWPMTDPTIVSGGTTSMWKLTRAVSRVLTNFVADISNGGRHEEFSIRNHGIDFI